MSALAALESAGPMRKWGESEMVDDCKAVKQGLLHAKYQA